MKRYTFDAENHVHKLGESPLIGTTSCLEIMGKVLTWWSSSLAVGELGWKNQKLVTEQERIESADKKLKEIKQMSAEGYLSLLDKAYKAHSVKLKDSATEGTDLHAAVEEYIKGKMTKIGTLLDDPRLETFRKWCDENVKEFLFSEIHTYSERLWVGGIVDFGFIHNDGRFILADIKSAKEVYYNHLVQMGGYDIQLTENGGYTATGDKVFTCPKEIDAHAVFTFGGKGFKEPYISNGTIRNKRSFECALQLYKDKNDFQEVIENGKH